MDASTGTSRISLHTASTYELLQFTTDCYLACILLSEFMISSHGSMFPDVCTCSLVVSPLSFLHTKSWSSKAAIVPESSSAPITANNDFSHTTNLFLYHTHRQYTRGCSKDCCLLAVNCFRKLLHAGSRANDSCELQVWLLLADCCM